MRATISLFACLLTLGASHGFAASNLTSNSPFLPLGFQPPGEGNGRPTAPMVDTPTQLEFQGVYQLNGQYQFLIFNRLNRESHWVGLNEARDGLNVTEYDLEKNRIAVNGLNLELIKLPNATGAPIDPVAAARTNMPSPVAVNRPGGPNSVGPTAPVRRRVIPPAPPGAPPTARPPTFTPPGSVTRVGGGGYVGNNGNTSVPVDNGTSVDSPYTPPEGIPEAPTNIYAPPGSDGTTPEPTPVGGGTTTNPGSPSWSPGAPPSGAPPTPPPNIIPQY